jgi:uncharacterized membrane protein
MLRDVQNCTYIFARTLHNINVKFYIHVKTRSSIINIKKVKKKYKSIKMLRNTQEGTHIFMHALHDTCVKFYIHVKTWNSITNIKKVKKI